MLRSFRQHFNIIPHQLPPKSYKNTLIKIHRINLEWSQCHPSSYKTLTHLFFYELYIARCTALWKGMNIARCTSLWNGMRINLEWTQCHLSSYKTLTQLFFFELYIARYTSLWKGIDFKISEPSLALKKCSGLTTVFDKYLL